MALVPIQLWSQAERKFTRVLQPSDAEGIVDLAPTVMVDYRGRVFIHRIPYGSGDQVTYTDELAVTHDYRRGLSMPDERSVYCEDPYTTLAYVVEPPDFEVNPTIWAIGRLPQGGILLAAGVDERGRGTVLCAVPNA